MLEKDQVPDGGGGGGVVDVRCSISPGNCISKLGKLIANKIPIVSIHLLLNFLMGKRMKPSGA